MASVEWLSAAHLNNPIDSGRWLDWKASNSKKAPSSTAPTSVELQSSIKKKADADLLKVSLVKPAKLGWSLS